jgi:DNA replication and repair protein RecF
MHIKSLELSNYRNYKSLNISFDENINIIFGDNAQGKTNILESIFLCAAAKSHRSAKNQEMIRIGSDDAHVRLVLTKKNIDHKIDIHLLNGKSKKIAVDQIPIKKTGQLLGLLNAVFFSPEDLNIIKNGPSERRKFMNLELLMLDKVYFHDLNFYSKALDERNKLLKQIIYDHTLESTLPVWDEKLTEYGKNVIETRERFIKEIYRHVRDISQKVTGGKEIIETKYVPDVKKDDLRKAIEDYKNYDMKTCVTNRGPHRDDIEFFIDGKSLKKFGSQGQQRTCALCLKLAEIEIVKESTGDTPVLLLDDVLSELDRSRQNYLLDNIRNIQTLITCTGLEEFVDSRFKVNKLFHVVNGNVE